MCCIQVINGTIEKDLATALKALSAADSALRKERLSLIREKVGKAADGLIINESGKLDINVKVCLFSFNSDFLILILCGVCVYDGYFLLKIKFLKKYLYK